jgi:hypothetical protein
MREKIEFAIGVDFWVEVYYPTYKFLEERILSDLIKSVWQNI